MSAQYVRDRYAVDCPDDDPLDSPHPACPSCWLTHPEGTCDR